jgi:hypothetical protein
VVRVAGQGVAPAVEIRNVKLPGSRRRESRSPCRLIAPNGGLLRCGDQSLADRLLARKLARAAYRFGFFPRRFFRRLFIKSTSLHLSKDALALHLFLQDAERLVNIVVANEYLQGLSFPMEQVIAWEKRTEGAKASRVAVDTDGLQSVGDELGADHKS